ncbi:Mu transposase C-terminal domain-containing protein [Clostridium sp. DJ247]|uniref:Mu transposase C-terminal domain-containing protein n=1 Tax=Clostridium sp. DJ247 TaxID=2726188 RepID=UPI0028BD409D|nr:Mu transposase C-terminal domain-containing protein [Clostridium sp. DJ247]
MTLRNSAKKYQQQHRAVLGSSSLEALGPASIYEIDATVADVYLVSRYNRNWIIGKAVIYTVIDRFSRMVVGLNVSLEGPSWLGAMVALTNAMSDKVEFCKEYGISISQDMWNTKYLCDTLIADRGELEGYNVENLTGNLGVKVQNTPSFRADWKPFVEQYFRLINLRVKPLLPGVIDEDFKQRSGKDYRLDAKLDLYQFTQVIIKCVLYFNNYRYLKGFNRHELMIQDDIEPIPSNIWNWAVKNVAGKLRTLPEDIIKLNLLPQSNAVVTEKGIRFKGVLYGSEKALREGWFEEARNNGHFQIKVSYDPRNLNFIYIITDKGMNFEKCFLLKHQERYIDRTVEEIEYLLQKESLEIKSGSSNELQAKVDLFSEIEDIVKKAESLTNNAQDVSASKASKIRDIRANREVEKSINRIEQAYELDKREEKLGEIIDFQNKNDTYEVISDMDILKQRQRQRRERFNE